MLMMMMIIIIIIIMGLVVVVVDDSDDNVACLVFLQWGVLINETGIKNWDRIAYTDNV